MLLTVEASAEPVVVLHRSQDKDLTCGSSSGWDHRADDYHELMAESEIDLEHLQSFCRGGVPEIKGARSLCWKVLLFYLPSNKAIWDEHLQRSRDQYQDFIEEFINGSSVSGAMAGSLSATAHAPHLLTALGRDDFFHDNEVLTQINKDVRRLNPDFSFFQQPTGRPRPSREPLSHRVQQAVLESATIVTNRDGLQTIKRCVRSLSSAGPNDMMVEPASGDERHWEVIERILFIYAKLNPGIKYVQGMNEILGPIYFCFAMDPDLTWSQHAEADAFFCFTNLMSEIRDVFIKTLDDSETGIGALMARLEVLLAEHRPDLAESLQNMSLKPQFYAFRWLTLLLSQEFKLPDLMRLWDTLFASSSRLDTLLHVCIAMLELCGDIILAEDFAACVKTLQNYPSDIDVTTILYNAERLRTEVGL
ncbi:uncharacterized protein MONBRDRAFT_13826 [Monosiga brevicollis MX1]|uniref:TBC1 domain family member 13 n=1 Tax=Monosiga brevicollis TaxID=81824 RepID=A9UQ07_MONBE|nr:uncharacterized protein MONBRDRAFT_13826 [Monosiga brevicollis MX1]EDQ92965.1 predicted protein [Monosiga brevicollis MX1]|eukprot:XP_001742727.1 hypothetical protein [Monosiga brevicollis MX1]